MLPTKVEIANLEKSITSTISNISKESFQYFMQIEHTGYFDEEYSGWTTDWMTTRLKDLYYLILAYLEFRQMPHYLQTFKTRFEDLMEKQKNILDETQVHPESETELKLLVEFRKFLEPFHFLSNSSLIIDENLKLKSLLENSGYIIKNQKLDIKNEADLYKGVKWIIGLYYPSVLNKNKARFISQFKTYNPDILVPEIKAAVEYKFLDSVDDNIDEYLDQLKVDATNYVGDEQYEQFYAVVYIENIAIALPESIQKAWESKKFPDNWELVITGHKLKNLKANHYNLTLPISKSTPPSVYPLILNTCLFAGKYRPSPPRRV